MTLCGTPAYIAPELVSAKGGKILTNGYAMDWWNLGIVLFELMCGSTPFSDTDRKQMYRMIENAPVKFPNPKNKKIRISDTGRDFIRKLLDKNPATRLGSK